MGSVSVNRAKALQPGGIVASLPDGIRFRDHDVIDVQAASAASSLVPARHPGVANKIRRST